jgi:hypothetical protein
MNLGSTILLSCIGQLLTDTNHCPTLAALIANADGYNGSGIGSCGGGCHAEEICLLIILFTACFI